MRKLTLELLDTRGFIFHVDALDIVLHFSDQELGDGTLSLSSLGCQYYRRFVLTDTKILYVPSSWTLIYPRGRD